MKTIIYLIRHSEALKECVNIRNADSEQIKNEKLILSVQGENKAEKISKNNELQEIDIVYSSSYVRAVSTAKYIANNNKKSINIDERLNERKLRRFRGFKRTR